MPDIQIREGLPHVSMNVLFVSWIAVALLALGIALGKDSTVPRR